MAGRVALPRERLAAVVPEQLLTGLYVPQGQHQRAGGIARPVDLHIEGHHVGRGAVLAVELHHDAAVALRVQRDTGLRLHIHTCMQGFAPAGDEEELR